VIAYRRVKVAGRQRPDESVTIGFPVRSRTLRIFLQFGDSVH
jgi:hypothetical protein